MEESWKPTIERRLVLDTSILIEYIVKKAPYRSKVKKLFNKAAEKALNLYVNPITLSETLYVASRIYTASKLPSPNEEALNYLEWIKTRANIVKITDETAVRAGELKKDLRITLPDCYVIATAIETSATPIFTKVEKEMEPVLPKLEKLGVTFLSQL